MSETELDLALSAIGAQLNESVVTNLGGDEWQFRDNLTGRFVDAINVWDTFRELYDTLGGATWLAGLGL